MMGKFLLVVVPHRCARPTYCKQGVLVFASRRGVKQQYEADHRQKDQDRSRSQDKDQHQVTAGGSDLTIPYTMRPAN